MSVEEQLKKILESIGIPVKKYDYRGTAEEYIVYNEEAERVEFHADNRPQENVVWWQVHIFTPENGNYSALKRRVRAILFDADFTITDVTTLQEEETKTMHVVISCVNTEKMEE